MEQFLKQPPDGDPSAAEIYRLFRSTTTASLEGLRLVLEECADLRAELVMIHGLSSDGDDHGVFSTYWNYKRRPMPWKHWWPLCRKGQLAQMVVVKPDAWCHQFSEKSRDSIQSSRTLARRNDRRKAA